MTLKRSILLEGPDGSGKSELFKKMTGPWGLRSAGHDGGPLRDEAEAWKRMAEFAACSPAVRDRCPAISELVYAQALGREPKLDLEEGLEWLEKFKPYVILCRPPEKVMLSKQVEIKPHKNEDLVRGIMSSRQSIINAYDNMAVMLMRRRKIKLHIYDFTQDPNGDFLWQALVEEGVCAD